MPTKFRSKFFRVAVEGATTDGRKIERQWIEDAAASYNTNTYGARVWLEHLRSLTADGPFRAYGDVVALKSEEVEVAGVKRLALFAQIEPTDELIALNKKRQKIYTSIELNPRFSDTGKAYMEGLAVTDSPASLGTEMLAFSAQHPDANPLSGRKLHPENLFSELVEIDLDFETVTPAEPSKADGLFARVREIMGKQKDKEGKDATLFNELGESVEAIAQHLADQDKNHTQIKADLDTLRNDYKSTSQQLDELLKKLEGEPERDYTQRPPLPGGSGQTLATY
ncbi:MAG TPA: GPO family capsid scaffolding protein [Pseudomonas sabulinigri]|uniref:Phage capsid protein n=1 Tax=marine sediment metagenome TaxID=412755 RepID=A0A0F9XXB7_9ZZZZ|nr:GPO family capsid scaffolding protein [Halopseudomonas sabulinigri]HEC50851.1 GPO family capsid scaffolding protein [Halopseudomonas sabulinigri]